LKSSLNLMNFCLSRYFVNPSASMSLVSRYITLKEPLACSWRSHIRFRAMDSFKTCSRAINSASVVKVVTVNCRAAFYTISPPNSTIIYP
ncbi:hypothetical protein K504DRAFT_378594, partial [Pleomassaria siparia CBS 279.74]